MKVKCHLSATCVRFALPLVVLGLAVSSARAIIDVTLQMQLGNATNATVDPNNHSHYLIQRAQYALDCADVVGGPNWVSWDLTSADIGSTPRGNYTTDNSLPATFYHVKTGDYTNSGYDRGHMCPSEDRTDNVTDNNAVFLMSNFLPQTADNNEGVWESFEYYARSLANAGDEVLQTDGGSIFNGSYIQPSGKVEIPGYTGRS